MSLQSPEIAELTASVLELKKRLDENRANAVLLDVDVGMALIRARTLLPVDVEWKTWLKEYVDISEWWAGEIVNLAKIYASSPEWVRRIAPLGEAKSFRAARASEGFRPALSPTWAWNGKVALQMTEKEFDRAVDEADPGHVGRHRTTSPKAIHVPDTDTMLACLQDLAAREPDPAQWRAIVEWMFRTFPSPHQAPGFTYVPPVTAPAPLPPPPPAGPTWP